MNDEIETLINDCEKRYKKLNDWEKEFIGNISKQFYKKKTLNQSQLDCLNKIWEKATS
jgi:hypothetical protein